MKQMVPTEYVMMVVVDVAEVVVMVDVVQPTKTTGQEAKHMQIQIPVAANDVHDVLQVECLGTMVVFLQRYTLQTVTQILLQDGSVSVIETTVIDHDRPKHRSAYGEAAGENSGESGVPIDAMDVNGVVHGYTDAMMMVG